MARRKAGDGLIRKRKDGRWEGRVVVGYDENGLPKAKNVLAKTKRECQEKLDKLKASLGAPPKAEKKCSPDIPFGEWLDHWYRTYIQPNVRPGTRENYELRIYKHITPQLGRLPLNKLTQGDLLRFYMHLKRAGRKQYADKLGKGLSDRMLRTCHALIKAALQKAVDEKLLRDNPAVGCKLPPQRAKEMQVLTPEEMQRFLIQAKYDGYYEIFLVALATGLRRGELLALQWDDLDLQTRELRVRRTVRRTEGRLLVSEPKTDAGFRALLLPPSVVKVLAAYKETIHSRWMFPSPVAEDAPRDPSTLAAKMKLVLQRAGCKIVRFHDLRHTFATEALAHGMDVKTLSAIIGHVSAATTLNVYTHVTGAMQVQAAQKIDKGIAGQGRGSAAGNRRKSAAAALNVYRSEGQAPQTRHGMYLTPQRNAVGGALLPRLARRQEASAQHLRPQRGGVRGKARGNDRRGKGEDRRRAGTDAGVCTQYIVYSFLHTLKMTIFLLPLNAI